jgi:hypothetical protein
VLVEAVNYYFMSTYLIILTFAKTSDNNRHEPSSKNLGGVGGNFGIRQTRVGLLINAVIISELAGCLNAFLNLAVTPGGFNSSYGPFTEGF